MTDDDAESIAKALEATHQLVLEIHSTFVATQLGVIAITEQLVEVGTVNPAQAAERMHDLTTAMSGLTEQAVRATQLFREHVASLAKNDAPPPGGGLTLVPKD